ncbi:MAG: methionine synthase [bacterium]
MAFTRDEDLKNRELLRETLSRRILITDGATGTALEALHPTPEDFGGGAYFGFFEMLNLHAPHLVKSLHHAYMDAGADIIETNTFSGSPLVMEEYGLKRVAKEIVRRAAELAREAVEEWSSSLSPEQRRPIWVMGSMGPGTKAITITGGVDFDTVREAYREYALGLLEGGVDLLVLETQQDTLNVKAELVGIEEAMEIAGRKPPVGLSVTIEPNGTMLGGQTIDALYFTVASFDLFFLGINCATGPSAMSDHIRTLAQLSRFYLSLWPNAGLPDAEGHYSEEPRHFAEQIAHFAHQGWINIAGGCCGTTPEHIRQLSQRLKGIPTRKPPVDGFYPALAGSEALVVESDNRPVYVGERTNTIGSRQFKRLIQEGRYDEAAEIGRLQSEKGAMALDLCTADPDRDEARDFLGVLKPLLRRVRIPLLVDTTDINVVELALKNIPGKPAINSVNLEDGGERLRKVAYLAKRLGASLICGLIDDHPTQGMAISLDRKREVAEKIYSLLKREFDFPDTDIIFDPLVFPAGTGDPQYQGSARDTVEGVRELKRLYPKCLTILGISNVSFGLPPAGREVLNSVFLYHCARAGLDLAIVNTQTLRRFPTIPPEEVALAEELLFEGSPESISRFSSSFREKKSEGAKPLSSELPLKDRAVRAIVEARWSGMEEVLSRLLEEMTPLEIINGPLLEGMDEVGRLFADNRLIVAEVLESAEVMKRAVDFLKPYFPPGESSGSRGRIILATVKGDVHDIGKNLVDMILSNNGYQVINLGIKVPPEWLIEAYRQHQPDIIGLSGLLVRSAQQMVATVEDLHHNGISTPILVGGAALTRRFTLTRIRPAYHGPVYYAEDAMDGLFLANKIMDQESREELEKKWQRMSEEELSRESSSSSVVLPSPPSVVSSSWVETDVPPPPDWEEHILNEIPLEEVLPYINRQMLLGKHLGLKGVTRKLKDPSNPQVQKLWGQVMEVVQEAKERGLLTSCAIYRWFPAIPEGEEVALMPLPIGSSIGLSERPPRSRYTARFRFPRQKGRSGLCAVDWIRPYEMGGDSVSLFVTSAGPDTAPYAAHLRSQGRLLASHILQAFALELAEATAEWLHQRIRAQWGFSDPPELTVEDLFRTRYRGIRLSFGYPACPQLEDQAVLFDLLRPERIGVKLTEGWMMDPESSVSAVVFHHPQGQYYAI